MYQNKQILPFLDSKSMVHIPERLVIMIVCNYGTQKISNLFWNFLDNFLMILRTFCIDNFQSCFASNKATGMQSEL